MGSGLRVIERAVFGLMYVDTGPFGSAWNMAQKFSFRQGAVTAVDSRRHHFFKSYLALSVARDFGHFVEAVQRILPFAIEGVGHARDPSQTSDRCIDLGVPGSV